MATVAKVEFISDNRRVVKKGSETSIDDLFTTQARQVGIKSLFDVRQGTDLTVTVDKLEPLRAKAANWMKAAESKFVGGNSLFALLHSDDRRKRLRALDDIKPDEKLTVTIETLNSSR